MRLLKALLKVVHGHYLYLPEAEGNPAEASMGLLPLLRDQGWVRYVQKKPSVHSSDEIVTITLLLAHTSSQILPEI